ncbi:MAG: 3-phosphoshikimate 1-carboxyvinyltransferase [Micavibrio sp.]|nr:3-phosphoshikimate 1-carboxyvinyltransferase [Micavibrio sp.]
MKPLLSKKTSYFKGASKVPGDKSISHRSLMFGALAVGETIISGLLEGEDVLATAQAMRQMGAEITRGSDGLWRVHGVGLGGLKQPEETLDMGNSGTSTRLLMGVVGGHNIEARFDGDASLTKRPMKRVMDPLSEMGVEFEASEGGRLPLTVKGSAQPLALEYRLPVASAQVKSAIMLAGLNARGTTCVIEEKPTRDHTEKMLKAFGVDVDVETLDDGAQAIKVKGGQDLQPCAIDVPGDPSSAAFPAVAATLIDGAEVRLAGICVNDRRDGVYRALQALGADVRYEHQRIEGGEDVADIVVKGGAPLKGCTLDPVIVPSMIDEFPVFAMAAACAEGTTYMSGLEELRVKESDRLLMVAEGLKACGVNLEMGEDSLTIHGTGQPPKGGARVETALDHRIAMAFLVLGCVSDEPIEIDDGAPIQTSFPNFVKLMNELGAEIEDIK